MERRTRIGRARSKRERRDMLDPMADETRGLLLWRLRRAVGPKAAVTTGFRRVRRRAPASLIVYCISASPQREKGSVIHSQVR